MLQPANTSVSIIGLSVLLSHCTGGPVLDNGKDVRKPNIIFILADDLGYGDLGCYGQSRIETPNIDRLAASGILFTQHYSGSPVSAPSRCVLLTGKHTGHEEKYAQGQC